MPGAMPVLRANDMRKVRGELIDKRNDCVGVWHRKRAAGAKVILNINDQQHLALLMRCAGK